LHREAFLSAANFQRAWQEVASNRGCEGVDGETIAHFAQNVDRYLDDLRNALVEGRYRPLPLRQLQIPKKQGGWRQLGVPTVRDRVVQQALLQVLHPLLEPKFEACSFAYRPGRSHLMAVRQVGLWRDRGYRWVLDADVVQYFDNINHDRLLAELHERSIPVWAIALLETWIKTGILTPAGIILPNKGVPQGAVISPILANVYLDDLDERLLATELKLVRFADDFVVLARTEQRIIQAQQEVAQILESMGLELHPEKTQMTNFERGFRFLGHAFAGDLVITMQPKKAIEAQASAQDCDLRLVHADPVLSPTAMQQALVEALKAAQQPIPPPLFVVLGYGVRPASSVSITSKEIPWKLDMSTLYLVQQGTTLRKEHDRFLVASSPEVGIEIPIREVQQVLVFGNIQLTTQVISTCLESQIPVIFLTQLGEYKGHLWSAEATDLMVETMQFERQKDVVFKLAMARELVQGKVWNAKQLLLRLNRKRQLPEVAAAIEGLSQDIEAVSKLESTTTLDQIRGYEGAAAARYFAALSKLIVNPGFPMTERAFHPPTDPINSLLSFGYTLLFNNVFSLLLAEGLNPYLGNLHGAERPKAYLAFDLMEEFRSLLVDTLVMKLVNKKILSPTDFSYPNQSGGVYLTDPARRIFLKHFEARICEKTTYRELKEQVSYRRVIQLQIQHYSKALLGNQPYRTFRRTN